MVPVVWYYWRTHFTGSKKIPLTMWCFNKRKVHDSIDKKRKAEPQVLAPGLVVLRNFVSDIEQEKLAKQAIDFGKQGNDGFYTTDDDGKAVLNTGENRGRIYDAATRFPAEWTNYCDEAVAFAQKADQAMPSMSCTHVLLNMYTTSDGLTWHRDIYENDGKGDHPVVNLCVGSSCVFAYKYKDEEPVRRLTLRSGDCLLFGGPCRLMEHAIEKVLLDQCPKWMDT